MSRPVALFLLLPFAATLAACGKGGDSAQTDTAAIDAALTGNVAASAGDPALTAALRDQIMVDPALVQQANDDTVRPPTQPEAGAVPTDGIAVAAMAKVPDQPGIGSAPSPSKDCPQCAVARQTLTIGALAQKQGGRPGQCASRVSYATGWANRLPAALPLYPDARVAEAAGTDGNGCALRIVSFASATPMQRLIDFYYSKASAAGFDAGHQANGGEHVLAGKSRSGAAFLAVFRSRRDGGTDVDLMADGS